MADETVLSVRGDAERVIAPDSAQLHCTLRTSAGTKPEALELLRAAQSSLTARLTDLGGQALTVQSLRATLTWSTRSIRTEHEHQHDELKGRPSLTGMTIAHGEVVIAVRDFALLAPVERALGHEPSLELRRVTWHVDEDNPAWREVRAEAIHASLQKGRDYAAALGGTVLGVQEIADAGLLEGGGDRPVQKARFYGVRMSGGGEPEGPDLDPVPQSVSAVIEARLIARIAPLAP